MIAAYRDYVAKRKAAQSAAAAGDEAPGAAASADWAKGTWFADLVTDKPDDRQE
ncbi:MAG: hypothetical protein IT538_12515 [Variibacter sp.]|nr:hypothetical protein [Variibacter sp.]